MMYEYTVELDGWEIDIEVTSFTSAIAGNISSSPENCFPSEDAEIEYDINKITNISGCANDLPNILSEDNLFPIITNLCEQTKQDAQDDYRIDSYETSNDLRCIRRYA